MNYKTRIIWNSSCSTKRMINSLLKEIETIKRKISMLEESKNEENNALKIKIKKLEKENLLLRINDHLNLEYLKEKNKKVNLINVKCSK